jgi:iron(III) transport system ATP-binding protein
VALARALAIKPDLVLLDEPFSSLDASLRATVRDDVRRVLSDAGTTALLVTHDQDEALSLADQVAVLRDGRIVQQASPADLYAYPVDPALARFVGDGNLVEGVVVGHLVRSCFGDLPLVANAAASLADGQATVVLIRPEQVMVREGLGGEGISGRVMQTNFHGHDTVITVRPLVGAPNGPSGGPDGLVQARLAEAAPLAAGTEVTLTAKGAVMAWPAPAPGLALGLAVR